MKVSLKRAGVLAPAAVIFAASFGTLVAGANAQDQEALAPEALVADAQLPAAAQEIEPEVRFVATPVVQEVPEVPAEPEFTASDAGSLHELVIQTDTTALSREVRCLAQAVYFESRGEPLAGQLAVARVVINRADNPSFPDDYCSVVTQRAQFSFVRGGRIPEPNAGTAAWDRAKAIARIAHRDLWESEAGDSLYFHATYVNPRWARAKQARATISTHRFYR